MLGPGTGQLTDWEHRQGTDNQNPNDSPEENGVNFAWCAEVEAS